jgi:hypothetical protein
MYPPLFGGTWLAHTNPATLASGVAITGEGVPRYIIEAQIDLGMAWLAGARTLLARKGHHAD